MHVNRSKTAYIKRDVDPFKYIENFSVQVSHAYSLSITMPLYFFATSENKRITRRLQCHWLVIQCHINLGHA
jgi:hypothetical protein